MHGCISRQRANEVAVCGGVTMNNRIVECASRAGRDFSEFMKGEKNMMDALRSAEEFTEQLRIHGCVNHHFVNFMMMKAIMKVFDDMQREEQRETPTKACSSQE